jgi:hypothetical protein
LALWLLKVELSIGWLIIDATTSIPTYLATPIRLICMETELAAGFAGYGMLT